MVARKLLYLVVFSAIGQLAFIGQSAISTNALAKEKCKTGYEWNRQTQKCQKKEHSY